MGYAWKCILYHLPILLYNAPIEIFEKEIILIAYTALLDISR